MKNELIKKSNLMDEILESAPKDKLKFIDRSSEIAAQIRSILASKGMKQKQLAALMNKEPGEISKYLSGSHNFTLNTLVQIESVLDAVIFTTPIGKKIELEDSDRREVTMCYSTINQSNYNRSSNVPVVRISQTTEEEQTSKAS